MLESLPYLVPSQRLGTQLMRLEPLISLKAEPSTIHSQSEPGNEMKIHCMAGLLAKSISHFPLVVVGWALRGETQPKRQNVVNGAKCWVLFLNPTYWLDYGVSKYITRTCNKGIINVVECKFIAKNSSATIICWLVL